MLTPERPDRFHPNARRAAFTLIELLIVVAIIGILAAIALPNFLEAQTRAKVAKVHAELRSLATAIETYCVDNDVYPEGTDNPGKYPAAIGAYLGPLAKGYYTFRTRGDNGQSVGSHFAGLTTPIAYTTSVPADPFAPKAGAFLTYCYRNAKDMNNGWILTSAGPDVDLLAPDGRGNTDATNPLSTASDKSSPARLADINEREVIAFYEGNPAVGRPEDIARLRPYLQRLSYDPTNGSVSDGDLFRIP